MSSSQRDLSLEGGSLSLDRQPPDQLSSVPSAPLRTEDEIIAAVPSLVATTDAHADDTGDTIYHHSSEPDTDRYGLINIGGHISAATWDPSIQHYEFDIVAVHGLNGDVYKTWTHESTKKLWLRDFLPSDLPGARIFSFGYPSEVAFTLSTSKLEDWARALLEDLLSVRTGNEESKRPIIFVCHSMGGLVVKQALITARIDEDDYASIRRSVRGILFFATPHRGSDVTTWPKLFSNLASIVLAGSSRFKGGVRADLIQSLQTNSPALTKMTVDFRNQVSGIKIISFKEQKLTPPFSKPIVDEHSSVMGIGGEIIVPMLDCDHQNICRFSRPTARSYLLVLRHIRSLSLDLDLLSSTRRTQYLKSFWFEEIDFRRLDIQAPLHQTCEWIFQHPNYRIWTQRQNSHHHHGILWLKGKPGSGKSTLMKRIIQHLSAVEQPNTILNFFFHARGTPLEHGILGFLRSIVYQLLRRQYKWPPKVVEMLREKFQMTSEPQWHQQELKDLLHVILMSFRGRMHSLHLCIDAVDECQGSDAMKGTDSWQDVINFLLQLSHDSMNEFINLNICMSRRHFPNLPLQPLEIITEDFNLEDIERYIQAELSPSVQIGSPIRKELSRRAESVFLWVRLTVHTVNQAIADGQSLSEILDEIRYGIPLGLSATFGYCFQKSPVSHREQAKSLFRWVFYAVRPLRPLEFKYAMMFELRRSVQQIGETTTASVTTGQLEQRIRALSGGLIEIRSIKVEQACGDQTKSQVDERIQFIHESVREYLLSGDSWSVFGSSIEAGHGLGAGHETLMYSCLDCIDSVELEDGFSRNDLTKTYPFLEYSVRFGLFHAALADLHGKPQVSTITALVSPSNPFFETWMKLQRHFLPLRNVPSDWTENHGHPLLTALERQSTPLHAMAEQSFHSFVTYLLKEGSDVYARDSSGKTPLHLAAYRGHDKIVELLSKECRDVNMKDNEGRTPLHEAAAGGCSVACNVLLAHGGTINIFGDLRKSEDSYVDTALHCAIAGNHSETAKLLVREGADVNLRRTTQSTRPKGTWYFTTPLQLAIQHGLEDVVDLMLSKGADPNACETGLSGKSWKSALMVGPALAEALKGKKEQIVLRLLKAGADVDTPDVKGATPLQHAIDWGLWSVVNELLARGASVNSESVGPAGSSLVIAAHKSTSAGRRTTGMKSTLWNAINGNQFKGLENTKDEDFEKLLRLLLNRDANVDWDISTAASRCLRRERGCCDTALQAAACSGSTFATRVLLEHGANVDLCGQRVRKTALRVATEKKHHSVVDILLRAGADPALATEANESFTSPMVIRLGRR